MILLDNISYREDLALTLKGIANLELLKGKTLLITGASGLIASALVDHLLYLNEQDDFGMTLYLAGRHEATLKRRFGHYLDHSMVNFVSYDATQTLGFHEPVDYIIHAASNANPRLYVEAPVDTMLANFEGMHQLLEFAREVGAKRLLYVSSSEVYGQVKGNQAIAEDDYGFVDLLNVRSSYASSKRATETLCISYGQQYGLEINIVRPGYIYGPSARPNDARISSSFIFEALKGKDIVMKSDGSQLRSYCHALDCSAAMLTVLINGHANEAYNIAHSDANLSIREFTSLITQKTGVKLVFELPNNLDRKVANPMQNSTLDGQKLMDFGWRCLLSPQVGLEHTINQLKELY